MAQEFYNPDIIDDNTPVLEQKPGQKSTKKDDSVRTKPKSAFFHRMRLILGILFALVGLLLAVAFLSYLKFAGADQSAILNNSAEELAKDGIQIKNWAGALGAWVSEIFISKWIGIGSFVFVGWLIFIGMSMLRSKKIQFFTATLISLLLIILSSLIMGYVSLHSPSAINYGGNLGAEVSRFLIGYVGDFGTFIIYLALLSVLVIVCLGSIIKALRKVRTLIPVHNAKEKDIFDKDNDIVEPDESKKSENEKIDFQLTEVPNEEQEKNITDDTPETIVADDADSKNDKQEDYSDYMPQDSSDNKSPNAQADGEITAAPPVEKAETILEPIDPTKELPHFKFPSVELLKVRAVKTHNVDFEEQESNKRRITEVLGNYGVTIKTINACIGPTVTLFEIVPADGVKIAKIKSLENDIALSIAALGIRIIAPIPGKGTIGIEVPNREPQIVSMRSVLESKAYQESTAQLPMALGCTIANEVFVADLCKMPHLLVAGATGQGKSVGLNAIITSLIYRKHPAELKFVLFDPKMVEFSLYERLQHHYLAKLPGDDPIIITDSNKAIATLNSLVILMEQRYLLLKEANVRNIELYNKKFIKRYLNPEKGHHFMPYIVVIIDEFADFISVAGRDVEEPISRIAQKARAVGIHMIIATQRPSANVITGKIKANFPGRISFRVSSMVDSRTIIDCSGAQQLVGKGDLLFTSGGDLVRLQCPFMDDDETIKLCDFIDSQVGYATPFELPDYVPSSEGGGHSSGESVSSYDRDPLLPEVAAYISGMDKASTSAIQRHFRIGYNRAGSIMDQLEAIGIVGPATGGKPRQVLVDPSQISQMI